MRERRKLRSGETFFIYLLLAFTLFVLYLAYDIAGFKSISSPGAFPLFASSIMLLSIVLVLLGSRKDEKPDFPSWQKELAAARREVLPRHLLLYIGLVILYMVAMEPLHFEASSFIFLLVSMVFLKGSSIKKSVLIAAGTLVCIYFIFNYLFRVVLP